MASIRNLIRRAKEEKKSLSNNPQIPTISNSTQKAQHLRLYRLNQGEIPHLPPEITSQYSTISIASVIEYIQSNHPDLQVDNPGQKHCIEDDDYVYITEFITPWEEIAICSLTLATEKDPWVILPSRRLKMFGGNVTSTGLIPTPVPFWMCEIFNKLKDAGIIYPPQSTIPNALPHDIPNHALLNYYEPGQGISPHLDGPAYSPQAVIISFLSSLMLSFWEKVGDYRTPNRDVMSFYLQPRSLFIMKNGCYNTLFHGIEEKTHDYITKSCMNCHTIDPKGVQLHPVDVGGDGDDSNKEHPQNHHSDPPTQIELNDNEPSSLLGCKSTRFQRLSLTIRRVDPTIPTQGNTDQSRE